MDLMQCGMLENHSNLLAPIHALDIIKTRVYWWFMKNNERLGSSNPKEFL